LLDERLAHRGRPGEDTATGTYRRPVDHSAAFEAEPGRVSAPARARLVTHEHLAGVDPVSAGAELRRAHHPSAIGATDQLANCGHNSKVGNCGIDRVHATAKATD